MRLLGTNPEAVHGVPLIENGRRTFQRPAPEANTTHMYSLRLVPCLCVIALLALLLTGCGLFRFLSHDPTEDIKDAATDLSSGVKGSAREFEARLRESSEKYREDIRMAAEGVSKIAKSSDDLVAIAKDSPAAFGEAVTRRALEHDDVQRALKSVTGLARSGERAVEAAEKGPVLLAAKIAEMQEELTKADGFITQQRIAILEELKKERIAISETIQRERAAVMKDLDATTIKVIQETSAQLQKVVGSALVLIILLVLVLWGLPFGAGVLVGRLTRKKS